MRRCRVLIACVVVLWALPASAEWLSLAGGAEGDAPRVLLVDETLDATTLDIEVPGLWLTSVEQKGATRTEIQIPTGSTLRQVGRPAVGTVARLLAVPTGANLDVEVLDLTETWIDAPPPVAAAPHPTRQADPSAWVVDEALYASDAQWPADVAVVEGPATLRDLDVARIELRTTRYDFATGRLGVMSSVRLRVHHPGPGSSAPMPRSPAFAGVADALVLNYELPDSGVPAPPESMLIVVEEALADAMQPLVEWKTERGLQVTVRMLEEVGSATEDVQAAITEAYETWEIPVTYVLLVGDNVPFYRGTYDNCASDHMFTTLDGGDLLPDVLISRIVGGTADEVSTQVNRFLVYERDPPLGEDAEWMRHATGAATNEAGMGPTDEQRFDNIAASMTSAGYTVVDKLYVTDGSGSATNVVTAVNEGRGLLYYLGHGSGYDFSSLSPPFGVSHVQQLNNTHAWPFLVDCSCLNGGFDGQDDSLDEAFMKKGTPDAPEGTIGVFGSSTSTSWDPAGDLAEGMAYGFLDHGHAYWGSSALWARVYVFESWGSGMDSEWLFQQWVLFGDASLMMRSQPPIVPEVDYPDGFPLSTTEFAVTVTVDGQPFPDATVALSMDDGFASVALTDADGVASFAISIEEKGDLHVVVTGRDLAPHRGTASAGTLGSAGCAASPFAFEPMGLSGFGVLLTGAAPSGSALALAALGLLAVARRLRRR